MIIVIQKPDVEFSVPISMTIPGEVIRDAERAGSKINAIKLIRNYVKEHFNGHESLHAMWSLGTMKELVETLMAQGVINPEELEA